MGSHKLCHFSRFDTWENTPHLLVNGCAAHSLAVIPLSSSTRRARSQQLTFKFLQKLISLHIPQTQEDKYCVLQVVL